MDVLILFAFFAGIATVLSPCVLPILPPLLAGSTSKGRLRPLGMILGIVVSFTLFTLALTFLVQAFGISPNFLRYFAIALIFFFGLVMVFPKLSDLFAKKTALFADAGMRLQPEGGGSGLFGGFVFGAALGLLWTPCAGPILAAITTIVATHSLDFSTVLLTLAYSLGAALPLSLIAFGGKWMASSSKALSKHADLIRKIFGYLTIFTAIAIAFHWDMVFQQKIADFLPPLLVEDNPLVREKLQNLRGEIEGPENNFIQMGNGKLLADFGKAPDFQGIKGWINTKPLHIQDLKGKVVLIDFWTYSCINCLRTLPYIEKWYADYKDQGLVVVGVHTPEFEFEKEMQNVKDAVKRLGVLYPVALDNDYATWQAYHNHYWPAHYLIDKSGQIRMIHFGEGGYVETENGIRELLGLKKLEMKERLEPLRALSPETYLGLERGKVESGYTKPLENDQVGLRGQWRKEGEKITSESDASYLDMNVLAKQVYLVLSGKSKEPLKVFLDGKLVREITVDGPRKYDILTAEYGRHQLSLQVPKGISAYAFTFGGE
jgi:cytochrome c biogenesis protein CcdA/thiol-disulfide isomerase/thioredoxin